MSICVPESLVTCLDLRSSCKKQQYLGNRAEPSRLMAMIRIADFSYVHRCLMVQHVQGRPRTNSIMNVKGVYLSKSMRMTTSVKRYAWMQKFMITEEAIRSEVTLILFQTSCSLFS